MPTSAWKTVRTILVVAGAATLLAYIGFRMVYSYDPFGQIFSVSETVINPQSMQRKLLNKEKVAAPALIGIQQWFNTADGKPITLAELKGKVVLVDFWTYSCINCIRTLPYITAWDKKYRDHGLVIIGVHTPEFNFEKDPGNVQRAMQEYGIKYPVALDNDYGTWRAYNNHFWPAKYFIDHEGNIVWQHFGEGKYEESEEIIQMLLKDAGLLKEPMEMTGKANGVDFEKIGTPEIYFGYNRISHFGSTPVPDRAMTYTAPGTAALNTFYLVGDWVIGPEHAELVSQTGKIIIRYDAKKANIVFDAGRQVTGEVKLDGRYLTADQLGEDVTISGGKSLFQIDEAGLYNFTNTPEYGQHTLELQFNQPGVKAFAFTFG